MNFKHTDHVCLGVEEKNLRLKFTLFHIIFFILPVSTIDKQSSLYKFGDMPNNFSTSAKIL